MRRRTWIILTAVVVAMVGLFAVGESFARSSITQRLAQSAPEGIVSAPSGVVLWGLANGTVPVTVTISEESLATAIARNAPAAQDTEVLGIRIDEYIVIEVLRETPLGEIPIEVAMKPVVIDDALTTEIVSVTAGGIEFPPSVLDGVEWASSIDLLDAGCVTVRNAQVESDTLVLAADAALACARST